MRTPFDAEQWRTKGGPRESCINNIIVSGQAIQSAENSGNVWPLTALLRNLLGELTALPQTPYLVWKGLLPLPKNPASALGLHSWPLEEKSWARPSCRTTKVDMVTHIGACL